MSNLKSVFRKEIISIEDLRASVFQLSNPCFEDTYIKTCFSEASAAFIQALQLLQLHQFFINTVFGDEGLVIAMFHNFALLKDNNFIYISDGG